MANEFTDTELVAGELRLHDREPTGYPPSMSNQADEPRRDVTPDVDVGMEEPPDDVLEQHLTDIDEDELDEAGASDRPLEANPADVEDQRRRVPVEDEHRDR